LKDGLQRKGTILAKARRLMVQIERISKKNIEILSFLI
jgi:hypothetical protein